MSSEQQRERALERANEIRFARAELKAKIASGEVFVASVLLDPPREARSWDVGGLLRTQRRWGSDRARKLLSSMRIPELKPVGDLTERQRRELARVLAERSPQLTQRQRRELARALAQRAESQGRTA